MFKNGLDGRKKWTKKLPLNNDLVSLEGYKNQKKKMGMFPSGLPDLAQTGLFWPLLAKFGLLKAS